MKGSDPARADVLVDTAQARKAADGASTRTPDSPTRSIKDDNPLMIQGGRSYLFWDTDEWKARSERWHKMHQAADQMPLSPVASPGEEGQGDTNHLAVRPPLGRDQTYVSQLSDERSSASEYDDAQEENETEMKCRHCGSRSFSARKLKTGTSLVCTKCGQQA